MCKCKCKKVQYRYMDYWTVPCKISNVVQPRICKSCSSENSLAEIFVQKNRLIPALNKFTQLRFLKAFTRLN